MPDFSDLVCPLMLQLDVITSYPSFHSIKLVNVRKILKYRQRFLRSLKYLFGNSVSGPMDSLIQRMNPNIN